MKKKIDSVWHSRLVGEGEKDEHVCVTQGDVEAAAETRFLSKPLMLF